MTFEFRARIWLYPGMAGWHFITLPKKQSKIIRNTAAHARRGFGSIRVNAAIGKTAFRTSIFPDTKTDSYLLPLKAEVRKKESIGEGDIVAISINIE